MPQGPISALMNALLPTKVAAPLQLGKQSDLVVGQLHGRKYLASYNNQLFRGANPSGVTTSIALAPTYVGLCLSNPAGSGKNLAVRKVSGLINVATSNPTAIGLIVGYAAGGVTVHTTALIPVAGLVNGAAPVANLDSACTLVGTPAWSEWLAEVAGTAVGSFVQDLEGGLILPPGAYAAIGTSIAGPSAGFFGTFEWEEFAA